MSEPYSVDVDAFDKANSPDEHWLVFLESIPEEYKTDEHLLHMKAAYYAGCGATLILTSRAQLENDRTLIDNVKRDVVNFSTLMTMKTSRQDA